MKNNQTTAAGIVAAHALMTPEDARRIVKEGEAHRLYVAAINDRELYDMCEGSYFYFSKRGGRPTLWTLADCVAYDLRKFAEQQTRAGYLGDLTNSDAIAATAILISERCIVEQITPALQKLRATVRPAAMWCAFRGYVIWIVKDPAPHVGGVAGLSWFYISTTEADRSGLVAVVDFDKYDFTYHLSSSYTPNKECGSSSNYAKFAPCDLVYLLADDSEFQRAALHRIGKAPKITWRFSTVGDLINTGNGISFVYKPF